MDLKVKDLASRIYKMIENNEPSSDLPRVIKEWITENSAYVSGAFVIDPKAMQRTVTPANEVMMYHLKKTALQVGEVALMECGEIAVKKTSVIINPKVDYNLSLLCWKLGGVKEFFNAAGNQIQG